VRSLVTSANVIAGCTSIHSSVLPRSYPSRRDKDSILIYGRLMSDYEVTLVNDNSMRCS
jgi:hypothetical protein